MAITRKTFKYLSINFAFLLGSYFSPVLHAVPIGPETLVNTTTALNQIWPDVAMHDDGSFVVVFHNTVAGAGADTSIQRFDALGGKLGAETQVNGTTGNDNSRPSIDADASKGFVVAWQDFGDDGSGFGIFAQRYNSAGVPQGGDIPVNTTTNDGQRHADIAVADSGTFLIAWEDDTMGNSKRGIRARVFNSAGAPLTGELDISDDPDIDHSWPMVSHDGSGDFVVAWESGDSGANKDVALRRVSSVGGVVGSVVIANVTSKLRHRGGGDANLDVGQDDDGNILVVWGADESTGGGVPGQDLGIFARRYDSSLGPISDAIILDTSNSSDVPRIVVEPHGDFVMTYTESDGSLSGPWLRRYHANGQPKGIGIQAHHTNTLQQDQPAVGADATGRVVVVWRDTVNTRDGDGDSVWARLMRFQGRGLVEVADTNSNGVSEVAALRVRQSDQKGRVQLKDRDGTPVRTLQYFNGYAPMNLHVLADLNSNGHAEMGVVQRRTADQRALLQILDASSEANVRNVFYSPGHTPLFSVNPGDTNSNGSDDVVVVLRRLADDKVVAQMRDSDTKALLRNVWLPDTQWPIDVAPIADVTGDQVDDVAFLLRNRTQEKYQVRVYNMVNGARVNTIFLPDTVQPQQIADIADTSGGGTTDLLVLVRKLSNDAVGVRVHDGLSGALNRTVWYRPAVAVPGRLFMTSVGDTNGDGVDEIAVALQRQSNHNWLVQSRDGDDGALRSDFNVAPGYAAELVTTFPQFAGNAAGIALLGYAGNLIAQVRVFDAEAKAELLKSFFPSP